MWYTLLFQLASHIYMCSFEYFLVIIQIYVILKACPMNCYAILYLAVVIATGYIHLLFT